MEKRRLIEMTSFQCLYKVSSLAVCEKKEHQASGDIVQRFRYEFQNKSSITTTHENNVNYLPLIIEFEV